jgi:hexosaminidase
MRRVVIGVAMACLATVWFGVRPAAASATCTGNIFNQTIQGNLVVPNEDAPGVNPCVLDNTTVTGSITVQRNGNLEMRDGTHVYGSVAASQPKRVSVHTQATGEPLNTIGVNLTINGSSRHAVASVLCGLQVAGSLTVTNVTRDVSIDADGPEAGCDPIGGGTNGPVSVGGNVSATSNAAEFELSHVVVRGSVSITSNTEQPELEGNHISGNLSCWNNTGGVDGGGDTNYAANKTGQCANI